jgi:hypothetical protein
VRVERHGLAVTVRLSGRLGPGAGPVLRAALMTALPMPCRAVHVDAGAVTHLDPEAVAVLLAAVPWAFASGADFGYVACPEWLTHQARSEGIADMFPTIVAAGSLA